MTNVLADLRFATRNLARSPAFAALAIITLAAGIGATTALFSLVDAVLLRPLPFKEPHRIVEIWSRTDQRTGGRVPGDILEALRAHATTLQLIGTHDPSGGVITRADGRIDISGEAVSANFLGVFGVAPLVGRAFAADDGRDGATPVMLVSHSFWQQYLGGDPNALGRIVHIDERGSVDQPTVPYTVVGIMPPDFRTVFSDARPFFWTPYAGNRSRPREREVGYEVVARLSQGVTVEDARREIEAIASALYPEQWRKEGKRIALVPLRDEVVGDRAYALNLLLAAVGLVLAVACANVAQLLLARSDGRLREFATRKAIGAGAGQLFRLALFESLLLSLAGGVAGVVLASWLVPVMLALAPVEIPRLVDASIDTRVLAVALAISVLTGCAFGLAPALRLSRLPVTQAIRPTIGAPSRQRARFRSSLVVVQVAAAVILFALASLVVQTFLTLLPSSPGFATASRAAFLWSIDERQFRDAADRRQRLNDWMERLRSVPGIASVGMSSSIPFGDDEPRNVPVRQPDDLRPAAEVTLRSELRAVSRNYLQLLEIPLVRGRQFAATDRAEAPRVALVNETLARSIAPAGDVLGRSIRVGTAVTAPMYEIVGVVADTRWWGMTLEPLNEVYTPLAQDRASFGFVIVESPLDITATTTAIRSTFRAAVPGASMRAEQRAVTLDEMIGRSVAGPRFSATLIGSFSATALILATIGLFGLVAYSVSQRRQELGIRSALGARPADLIRTSVRTAVALTATGIASGLAASAYLTRFVESQLYAIEPLDPPTFAAAAVVMLVAAALAAYLPARRAAHTDPMSALRYE
jgi:putative ABC transport system permease protein